MEIDYKKFDEYLDNNKEKIINFLINLISILEVNQKINKSINASVLINNGFDVLELPFLIQAINQLLGRDSILHSSDDYIYFHDHELMKEIDKSIRFPYDNSYERYEKEVDRTSLKYIKRSIFLEFKDGILLVLRSLLKEILNKGYGKESKVNNKIILNINKNNKTISKNSKERTLVCSFRGKTNKRFDYLIRLAKNNGKIGASELDNTTYQNISTEINKINERLIDDLDLIKNVIKNDGNSGYEIDKDFYSIIFE